MNLAKLLFNDEKYLIGLLLKCYMIDIKVSDLFKIKIIHQGQCFGVHFYTA